MCIAEAFYWEKDLEWLWEGIKKLNKIRNSFSHKLEPKNYDNEIQSFVNLIEKEILDEFGKSLSIKSRLVLAMYCIYYQLCTYIEASESSELENKQEA